MNILTQNMLQDIYQKTSQHTFITLNELEVEFGISGSELRPLLEDLKEGGLIVEHKEGFQVSPGGINYCKTKWV